MKFILRQLAQLVLAVVVLYAALLAITLLIVPRHEMDGRLDTARAGTSLFLTEPKYVFLARNRLDSRADKAILLGASNMLVGFKQREVQALVPRMEVHNLSVGGSNITQIDQIVDLVHEVQTPEARRHDTFVIGLWYGIFAKDEARWSTPDRHDGDTDIDIERYRYGFYQRSDSGPVAVLPPGFLELGVVLIHPYLVLDRAARDLGAMLRSIAFGNKPSINDGQRNAMVLSEDQHRAYLEFWREYMGDVDVLESQPFTRLDGLVSKILANGGQVILVDLPIPEWHAKGSPLWQDYNRRIQPQLDHLGALSGVTVLKMANANKDADFSDEVHPKPRVTSRWAASLATVLNQQADLSPRL